VEGAGLVRRAVYLAALRNFPGPDEAPHRPGRLLWAMGRRPFTPSLVVDVSNVYDRKRAALGAYPSQFTRDPGDPRVTPISEPDFLARVEARDRVYGGLIGAAHGEPFLLDGPFPVRDSGTLLGEERP
jgi:LmbE family N-acetylglucosaminyl deacetylase